MAKFFDKVLTIISAAAVAVILAILVMVAIDIVTPQDGPIGPVFDIKRKLKTIAFFYKFFFAPGIIVSIIYAVYIGRRFLGRPKSYTIELLTILAFELTIIAYAIFMGMLGN